MDGRCQDEYFHCTSPGLADRRVDIAYRCIRNHIPSCPLAAGVLGSLPTCAQGSSVLGPDWVNSSVPVWVLLGFLEVLICGLLIVLLFRASCRSYHKEHLFFPLSSGLGVSSGGCGICAPVGNPGGPLIGQGIMAVLVVGFGGLTGCLVCQPGGDCSVSLDGALLEGDVSRAWLIWSHAAEEALADAHRLAGGPERGHGVKLGRGHAQFSVVRLGGPKMRSARSRCADPGDGAQVDLYRDTSIAL